MIKFIESTFVWYATVIFLLAIVLSLSCRLALAFTTTLDYQALLSPFSIIFAGIAAVSVVALVVRALIIFAFDK